MALPAPRKELLVPVDEDRQLEVCEYGFADGPPVMLFPGAPVSMAAGAFNHAHAVEEGVRLIVLGRPGYGRSGPLPQRRLIEWPADVARVADHLGLDVFAVCGNSAGGPHALAAGAVLQDRVNYVAIVSGPAEHDASASTDGMNALARELLATDRSEPLTASESATVVKDYLSGDIDDLAATLAADMPDSDKAILAMPLMQEFMNSGTAMGTAGDNEAMGYEWWLMTQPWGFDPASIQAPVRIWHGELDRNCPLDNAERLAASIPGAEFTVWPKDGHMVMAVRAGEVFSDIRRHAAWTSSV